jgi:predicted O-methyltransferase YrrM
MRQFFKGDEADFYRQLVRVTTSVLPIKSAQEKWDIRTKPGVTYEALGSDLSSLHLLQLLVRLGGYDHVLEIGAYIGVSTLFLAEAVGEKGRVTTIEVGSEFAEIARRISGATVSKAELNSSMMMLPARCHFEAAGDFRHDFLDGDKASYGRCCTRCWICFGLAALLR